MFSYKEDSWIRSVIIFFSIFILMFIVLHTETLAENNAPQTAPSDVNISLPHVILRLSRLPCILQLRSPLDHPLFQTSLCTSSRLSICLKIFALSSRFQSSISTSPSSVFSKAFFPILVLIFSYSLVAVENRYFFSCRFPAARSTRFIL